MATVRTTKGFKKQIAEEAVELAEAPQTSALVMIRVSARAGENVAKELAKFDRVEDVYAIMGDSDIAIKVRFANPKELKQFLMADVSAIEGVENTRTLLIMDIYKDAGLII